MMGIDKQFFGYHIRIANSTADAGCDELVLFPTGGRWSIWKG